MKKSTLHITAQEIIAKVRCLVIMNPEAAAEIAIRILEFIKKVYSDYDVNIQKMPDKYKEI